MTGPLAEPDATGADAAALVRALKEQAFRLGLVWILAEATVAVGGSGATPTVLVDGDTVAVPAVSMVGMVATGQRVFVFRIPPSGIYVVGRVGGSNFSQVMARDEAACTLLATLTTTPTLVTGATVTMTALTDVYYEATGFYDLESQVAGASVGVGYLYVDSVQQTRQAIWSLASVSRGTAGQQWSGTLSAGSHTFEMYAGKSAAAATGRINAIHTNLKVTFYA